MVCRMVDAGEVSAWEKKGMLEMIAKAELQDFNDEWIRNRIRELRESPINAIYANISQQEKKAE
jgi:hypothetical protein